MKSRNLAAAAVGLLILAASAFAQTTALEGDVKDKDGSPLKGAWVKIERKDITAHYKVKTDKRGHYFYGGLPLGTYDISVEVDEKVADLVKGVRTKLGDPTRSDFDLQKIAKEQQATQKAMETGTLTKEQERSMSPAQKAALEKAMKEREGAMKKNKELNDAFNSGMAAITAKDWDTAVTSMAKASELDPNQTVVWAHLAEAYMGQGGNKTGDEQQAIFAKGLDAYTKAIAQKPDDAGYINNYALALVKAKKIPEAQEQLTKAAVLDPGNAGRYYYNLGAVLTNLTQTDAACEAFKKAIDADKGYADAQYQYGVCLVAKAQIGADGKVTPVEGTKEAFEAYLALKPDGPFAQSSKDMLNTIGASVDTSYKNPNAPAATKKGKKK